MTPDQRAQLIEAIEERLDEFLDEADCCGDSRSHRPRPVWLANEHPAGTWMRAASAAVLDALFAHRFPCPEENCENGIVGGHWKCSTCKGSGEADSPRIALVEQVGWKSRRRFYTVDELDAAGVFARRAVPVFVELVVPDRNLESDGSNPSFVVPDQEDAK